MQLHVVVNQLATALGSDGKDLLAIAAGDQLQNRRGASGKVRMGSLPRRKNPFAWGSSQISERSPGVVP